MYNSAFTNVRYGKQQHIFLHNWTINRVQSLCWKALGLVVNTLGSEWQIVGTNRAVDYDVTCLGIIAKDTAYSRHIIYIYYVRTQRTIVFLSSIGILNYLTGTNRLVSGLVAISFQAQA